MPAPAAGSRRWSWLQHGRVYVLLAGRGFGQGLRRDLPDQPDHTVYHLEPGRGVTRFEYHHHGTTNDVALERVPTISRSGLATLADQDAAAVAGGILVQAYTGFILAVDRAA